jgi:hypothetical protein
LLKPKNFTDGTGENMPSANTAKVTRHSGNKACCELHHISAHFALAPMVGIVSIALYISFCFLLSFI